MGRRNSRGRLRLRLRWSGQNGQRSRQITEFGSGTIGKSCLRWRQNVCPDSDDGRRFRHYYGICRMIFDRRAIGISHAQLRFWSNRFSGKVGTVILLIRQNTCRSGNGTDGIFSLQPQFCVDPVTAHAQLIDRLQTDSGPGGGIKGIHLYRMRFPVINIVPENIRRCCALHRSGTNGYNTGPAVRISGKKGMFQHHGPAVSLKEIKLAVVENECVLNGEDSVPVVDRAAIRAERLIAGECAVHDQAVSACVRHRKPAAFCTQILIKCGIADRCRSRKIPDQDCTAVAGCGKDHILLKSTARDRDRLHVFQRQCPASGKRPVV